MDEHVIPIWHGMAAGGSSAIISRLFTYPPDTVKSRLQVQTAASGAPAYAGTVDAFYKIAKSEGVGGFYRGFGAILLTVIPANMCYFSGYEFGKRITPRNLGLGSDLITATIAQTVAGVVFCPIDIVKQRVQTAAVLEAGGGITALEAAKDVWRNQGIRGFYRGYWTMNALWYPWNTIYLTMYEASKRRVYHWQLEKDRFNELKSTGDTVMIPMQQALPIWAFPVCSSSCAAFAAVVTHPIDVVKTRLQVLSTAHYEKGQRHTVSQVMKDLYHMEGFSGFTRGLGARVTTMSLGSSISWFVYEMVKRQLARRE